MLASWCLRALFCVLCTNFLSLVCLDSDRVNSLSFTSSPSASSFLSPSRLSFDKSLLLDYLSIFSREWEGVKCLLPITVYHRPRCCASLLTFSSRFARSFLNACCSLYVALLDPVFPPSNIATHPYNSSHVSIARNGHAGANGCRSC